MIFAALAIIVLPSLPGPVPVTTDGVSLTIKKNGRWLPTIWFDAKRTQPAKHALRSWLFSQSDKDNED